MAWGLVIAGLENARARGLNHRGGIAVRRTWSVLCELRCHGRLHHVVLLEYLLLVILGLVLNLLLRLETRQVIVQHRRGRVSSISKFLSELSSDVTRRSTRARICTTASKDQTDMEYHRSSSRLATATSLLFQARKIPPWVPAWRRMQIVKKKNLWWGWAMNNLKKIYNHLSFL